MSQAPMQPGTWGDITIHSRDGKIYARASYRHANGATKRHEKQGASERDAKKKLREQFKSWSDTGDVTIGGRTRVAEVAQKYLDRVRARVAAGASPNTLRLYESTWRNHLDPLLGELRLNEVTTQRVDGALAQIASNSPDSAKLARAVLNGVMKIAKSYGAVTVNPMHDIDDVPGKKRKTPEALDGDTIAELFLRLARDEQAVRRDIPDLVMWMLGSTDRIGNALAPRWLDVGWSAGTASIGPNVIRVTGGSEDERGLWIRPADGSTKNRSRVIDLPAAVVRMLRARWVAAEDVDGDQLLERHRLGPPGVTVAGQGLVFPCSRLTGPLDPSNVNRSFREAMANAEMPWITPHWFRKTGASALDEAGLSARATADRLGHSRPSMTQDVYMKRRSVNPLAVAALDALLPQDPVVTQLRPRKLIDTG